MPSNNPYTGSYVGSFFAELSPEEKAMLNPMYQNIGQQQNFQTQQMAAGNALTQAAGQPAKGGGSLSPASLAAMLRKGNKTELSDAQKKEISDLGSNSWNPYSDYNTGANGWGNYGE